MQAEHRQVPGIPMAPFVPETALQVGQIMAELVRPELLARDG